MATYEKSVRTTRTTSAGYYYYKLVVTENSVNQDANTSNVTAELYLKGPWNPSFEEYQLDCGIQLLGVGKTCQARTWPTPDIGTSYVLLCTLTDNVPHNADGTLDMVCKCWITNNYFGDVGYLPLWFSSSGSPMTMGTMTLTPIPKEAKFDGEISDFTWESAINIPIIPSPYLDELKVYSYEGELLFTRDGYTGPTLILTPEELLDVYTICELSEDVDITLTTYKDGSVLGTHTETVTATIGGQFYKDGHRYRMVVKDNGVAKVGVAVCS